MKGTMEFDDYRSSHQHKGDVYDGVISSSPFERYMDDWEKRHLLRIIPQLFPTGKPRCLDFACGTGRVTSRVEPMASESYGVDVSESMLNSARAKCRSTTFVCADLTKEDVDLGTFDVVTAFRFFGNAQDELRASALHAIHRRLRPGGYLVMNNHRNPNSFLAVWRRLAVGKAEMDLSLHKLKSLLRAHGFIVV